MCSVPVTFGGGITMRVGLAAARRREPAVRLPALVETLLDFPRVVSLFHGLRYARTLTVILTVVSSAKSIDDPQRFSYFLRVRYGECDAQKVVFNSRYADYVDLAAAEFLRVLGFEHEIQTAELDYQLVKQTTQWRAPARYDQVLEISVSTKHLGTTSFTLRDRVPHRRRGSADRDQRDGLRARRHAHAEEIADAVTAARSAGAGRRGQARRSRWLSVASGFSPTPLDVGLKPDLTLQTLWDSRVQPRSRYCL